MRAGASEIPATLFDKLHLSIDVIEKSISVEGTSDDSMEVSQLIQDLDVLATEIDTSLAETGVVPPAKCEAPPVETAATYSTLSEGDTPEPELIEEIELDVELDAEVEEILGEIAGRHLRRTRKITSIRSLADCFSLRKRKIPLCAGAFWRMFFERRTA